MKLPRLIDHPDQAGCIVCRQSAMKQLQKRKELHHEKTKHLFQPKSRTSWAFRTSGQQLQSDVRAHRLCQERPCSHVLVRFREKDLGDEAPPFNRPSGPSRWYSLLAVCNETAAKTKGASP